MQSKTPYTSLLSTHILYGCLQRVTIPEAVVIQLVLLMMSSVLLETCWGVQCNIYIVEYCKNCALSWYFEKSTLQLLTAMYILHTTDSLRLSDDLQKLRKASIAFVESVCLSVRPHEPTRLPRTDFYNILYFWIFRRSVRSIKIFIKFGQEKRALYIKTNVHSWHPAE